jgi:tetratricopeptide (TPR) repeat protein
VIPRGPGVGAVAALVLALLTVLPVPAGTQDAVAAARALLAAWHEDPARIDRARTLLEAAAAAAPAPETLTELSSVTFRAGEFRAGTEPERIAAYERGAEAARRAVAASPRSDRAHFMLAINYGRLAEIRGVMRAVTLVGTIREESATVLRLNPSNVEGLILAGSLAAEMPALLGGDRVKAEALFKRALELDPHRTGGRLELARLYLASRRWPEAQRELQHVIDEPAATDIPRWTVGERPRARALLAELYDRGLISGPQSP